MFRINGLRAIAQAFTCGDPVGAPAAALPASTQHSGRSKGRSIDGATMGWILTLRFESSQASGHVMCSSHADLRTDVRLFPRTSQKAVTRSAISHDIS
jgi:hypothetical protein